MARENLIQTKSYNFSIRIIKLYKYLVEEKKEFVLSKQLLRCGTSIGANVEEAIGAQSRKDFISKMAIAYKEARETSYWIRLMNDTGYIDLNSKEELLKDLESILKIITKIQLTSKANVSV